MSFRPWIRGYRGNQLSGALTVFEYVRKSLFLTTAGIGAFLVAAAVSDGAALAERKAPPLPSSQSKDRADLPRTIVVSLAKQRMTVYQGTRAIASSRISSGKAGHRTPKGVFSIIQKRRRHYSNLYNGAPMPYMQRITWSGVAFHAGHIPGYPASHGCIRMPYGFAKQLFSMTSMNDRVVVTDHMPEPRGIAHDGLLKPLPPGEPEAATTVAADETDSAAPTRKAGTVQWLMGVATANAAEVYGDLQAEHRGPLTRASVAAARQRHLETLASKSEEAGAWAREAGERLKAANAEIAELVKAPRMKQVELASLRRTEKRLENDKLAIERELRDFVLASGASGLTKPVQTAKLDETSRPRPTRSDAVVQQPAAIANRPAVEELEQREGDIEARLMAKLAEIDAAAAEIAALQKSIASHDQRLGEARTRRDILKERYVTAKNHFLRIKADHEKAKQAAELYDEPITVLVSRKTGKLYVRQDHKDILEAPVTFADPDSPVGTHVFTAMAYNDDETDLVWKVITTATGSPDVTRPRGMSSQKWRELQREAAARTGKQTPERALARLEISEAVRTRLAELIKPGSTVMISDNGKSLETGEYTDLIVQY